MTRSSLARSSRVTGLCGLPNTAAVAPSSTMRPWSMTATRLQSLAGHGQRVGDDHQRDAQLSVDVLQKLQDGGGGARVKGAGGLVAEHDLGVVGQRTGDGHALLLTAGKLAGIALGKVGQTHQLEQLHGALAGGLALLAAKLEREGDVAQDGALLEQTEVLEDRCPPGCAARAALDRTGP